MKSKLLKLFNGQALSCDYDICSARHQGTNETPPHLRQQTYLVNMANDINQYCCRCVQGQWSKLQAPTKAYRTSVPIHRQWQTIAVNILEVSALYNLSQYMYVLLVQDYFTNWAEGIPVPDQSATQITPQLVKLFQQWEY